MAIEGFILEHWEQLASLQDKQDYAAVRDRFVNRVQRLCEKDKNRIVREIRSSEDVMKLILKARTSELNEGDKETVREQLLTVLRTIPTFVIVSLPQHFLTLPLLMKVLPRDIFAEV